MAHFAHYVKREVVELDYASEDDPWFKENQPDDQGFEAPAYHVTRSTNGPVTRRYPKGDTLWIFSQLKTPWGAFPPALDAKLIVNDVEDLRKKHGGGPAFRFAAGKGSTWFPLLDATTALGRISTIDSTGHICSLLAHRGQPVGRALQSLRQVADTSPLLDLEQSLCQLGFDFVSYRLIDGTKTAFEKSLQLVLAGKAVFWDRWSLPRRLAERREIVSDETLNRFLLHRIEACTIVWGIKSPRYSEVGSYSWREQHTGSRLGKLRAWPESDP